MTVSREEFKELFGAKRAWTLVFVNRPENFYDIMHLMLEDIDAARCVNMAIDGLLEERKRKSKKPTLCLLCDNNFMHHSPKTIVVMKPEIIKGNAGCFLLCDTCGSANEEDVVKNVKSFLAKRLDLREIFWGQA